VLQRGGDSARGRGRAQSVLRSTGDGRQQRYRRDELGTNGAAETERVRPVRRDEPLRHAPTRSGRTDGGYRRPDRGSSITNCDPDGPSESESRGAETAYGGSSFRSISSPPARRDDVVHACGGLELARYRVAVSLADEFRGHVAAVGSEARRSRAASRPAQESHDRDDREGTSRS